MKQSKKRKPRKNKADSLLKPKIIFKGKKAVKFVLEALEKSINKSGFVVDADTGRYTLDADGKRFKASQFIGTAKKKFITDVFQLGRIIQEERAESKLKKK